MKRTNSKFLILVVLFLSIFCVSSYAQKKGNARKPKAKKTVTTTQKKQQEKPKQEEPAVEIVEKHQFEGRLLYKSYEYHNKSTIRFSYGTAYNGERETEITIKGNKMKISDYNTHLHTIINPDGNQVILFSDLTGTGCSMDFKTGSLYFTQLLPGGDKWKLNFTSPVKKEYKLDNCYVTKSNLVAADGINGSGNIEIWYSDAYYTPDVYRYYSYGAFSQGIIKKWIYTMDIDAIIMNLRTVVSSELVALDEHEVDASELECPSWVSLTPNAGNKEYSKILKENKKIMKKLKIKPVNEDAAEMKYKINEEWGFVKQWIDEKENEALANWTQVGEALFEVARMPYEQRRAMKESRMDTEDIVVANTSNVLSGAGPNTPKIRDFSKPEYDANGNLLPDNKTYAEFIVCRNCRGTRVCQGCHGSRRDYNVYGSTKCWECKGKGICGPCKGNGYYKTPAYMRPGYVSKITPEERKARLKREEQHVKDLKKKVRDTRNGQRADRVYDNYSNLIRSISSGSSEGSIQDIREYQETMKELRSKHPKDVHYSSMEDL